MTTLRNRQSARGRKFFTPLRLDLEVSTSPGATRQIASLGGLLGQGVSRFGVSFLTGRIGGPSALGALASMLSFSQIFALMWPAATASATTKFVARARGAEERDLTLAVAAHLSRRCLVSAFALAIGAGLVWHQTMDRDQSAFWLVTALVLGLSGQVFVNGVQYATGQHLRAAQWDIAISALSLLGVAALLFLGVRGLMIATPIAVASLTQSVARWPYHARGRVSRSLRREIDHFIAVATVGTLTSAGFFQLSLMTAVVTQGAYGAGQYAAVLVLATPLLLLVTSLSQVLYPKLAEAFGRTDLTEIRRLTESATVAIAFIMGALTGAIAVSGELLVALIWGPHFSDESALLPLMLGAVLVSALTVPSVNYLSNHSQREATLATAYSVIGAAVGVLLWILLALHGGLPAIAVGFLSGKLVFAILTIRRMIRSLGIDVSGTVIRLLTASILVFLLCAAQRQFGLPLLAGPALSGLFLVTWLIIWKRHIGSMLRYLPNLAYPTWRFRKLSVRGKRTSRRNYRT